MSIFQQEVSGSSRGRYLDCFRCWGKLAYFVVSISGYTTIVILYLYYSWICFFGIFAILHPIIFWDVESLRVCARRSFVLMGLLRFQL